MVMKKLIVFCIALLLWNVADCQTPAEPAENPNTAGNSATPPVEDMPPLFNLFNSNGLKLDFKFIDPLKGSFGIDYDLLLSSAKEGEYKSSFNLKSKGFVTVSNSDLNNANSLVTSLSYTVNPNFSVPVPSKKPRERNPNTAETDGQDAAERNTRLAYIWLDFHANHETTQDFDDYNYAFGGSLIADLPFLARIVDLPFSILKTNKTQGVNKLELEAKFDYLSNVDNTKIVETPTPISSLNRVTGSAFFETEIMNGIRFVFNGSLYHILNAPVEIKAVDKSSTYFYEARLDIPLGLNEKKSKKWAALKYTEGALPPNYTKGYVLGGGFFLSLN